jgi:hypothetical protein
MTKIIDPFMSKSRHYLLINSNQTIIFGFPIFTNIEITEKESTMLLKQGKERKNVVLRI